MTKRIAIISILMIFAVSLTLPGIAQQSRTQNQPEASSAYAKLPVVSAEVQNEAEVIRLCQGVTVDEAGKATINNFLQGYFFARWTDQNNASEFAKYRSEIPALVGRVSNASGKEVLLNLLAIKLYNFANKQEYYPACRYNAILALGELAEGVQADGTTPIPYTKALQALYQTYTNKGDGADPAREAIRLGALQGIRRHVILGISNTQARDGLIAKLLMDIAADTPYQKDEPSPGSSANRDDDVRVIVVDPNANNTSEPQRTVDLHNWFRNTAIETLGYYSTASGPTQNDVIQTLLARINDDLELPSIRYQSAYSLARFNRAIESSPDLLKQTTAALLILGLCVHDDGRQTMMDERSTQQTTGSIRGMGGGSDMMSGGGPSGMMSGGVSSDMSGGGASMGQTQADQINNSLIQIKDGFSSIAACLQGAGGLVNSDVVKNTPYHEILFDLNKTINECIKFFDEGDPNAKARANATAQFGGMDGTTGMGGPGTTATVKNQPKVDMREIETRLKIVKTRIEYLQGMMKALESGNAKAP